MKSVVKPMSDNYISCFLLMFSNKILRFYIKNECKINLVNVKMTGALKAEWAEFANIDIHNLKKIRANLAKLV